MEFKNFQSAYIYFLEKIYVIPDFINSPRGNNSKEILNVSFKLLNPVDRVCYIAARKSNIIFNFAEAIWYLMGDNSLDYISYYSKNMTKYSSDGKTLKGTAYGTKIFTYGSNKINQWNKIIKVFEEDKDTKRAVISIFDANEELQLSEIDVSCTIGLHFLIRANSLYMSTFMRANDAYRGVVSDIFSFTFIQEFLATQLSLGLGTYCHNVSTHHIYEHDYKQVEKILSSDNEDVNLEFPQMPQKNNWEDLRIVADYEEKLRKGTKIISYEEISGLNIDNYWKQVIFLFAIYRDIIKNNKINEKFVKALIPIYKYFVINKWGHKN